MRRFTTITACLTIGVVLFGVLGSACQPHAPKTEAEAKVAIQSLLNRDSIARANGDVKGALVMYAPNFRINHRDGTVATADGLARVTKAMQGLTRIPPGAIHSVQNVDRLTFTDATHRQADVVIKGADTLTGNFKNIAGSGHTYTQEYTIREHWAMNDTGDWRVESETMGSREQTMDGSSFRGFKSVRH